MIVKICGIRTFDEAHGAIEAGADMIGFNFYPKSVRYLEPADCARIQERISALHSTILTVGIFVKHSVVEIESIMERCALDLAQLSGNEQAADLNRLGRRAFRAIRPRTKEEAEEQLAQMPVRADAPAFLIDTYHPHRLGGTGETGEWGLAAVLAARYPVLLAGGLNPANVATAVRRVQPWGVDVASGVEDKPGRKDPARIREFIRNARQSVTKKDL